MFIGAACYNWPGAGWPTVAPAPRSAISGRHRDFRNAAARSWHCSATGPRRPTFDPMSHRLPAFLLGFALAGQVLAQATSLNLNRIERPWPSGGPGVQALTVGSFVPNHDGATAVVAINGALFSSFQPALWQHFAASGGSGVQRLATVVARDGAIGGLPLAWGGTDRLAGIRADGLRLLQYSATGFVDAALPNISDPSWAGAIGVASGIEGTGAVRGRYVLGWSPTWVKLSVVDPALGLLPVATFPAPPGVAVHDAALIDWTVGGAPEVAVLLANGTAVLDVNGLPVAWLPRIAGEGRLCAWRRNNLPALSVVCRPTPAANLAVHTHQPGGYYFSGGSFPLTTALTGVLATTIDGDVHPDLLISHTGTTRLFVLGTADGPSVNGQNNLRAIHDVATNQLPVPVPSNLVPAVVTDVNRDGLVDLLVASAATEGVVLQLGLLPQMASALQNGGNSSAAGVDGAAGLQFHEGLGIDDTVAEGLLPVGVDRSGLHLLGLRLKLPSNWSDFPLARAVVYGLGAADEIQVDTATPYTYTILHSVSDPDYLTIYVPLPQAVDEEGVCHAVELALTNTDGTKWTSSLLLATVNFVGEVQHTQGAPSHLPWWADFLWWYVWNQFYRMYGPTWNLPNATGQGVLVGGNRYIGEIGLSLDPVTEEALANLPAPTSVTGGSATHK
jgi:hypothetical protein